MEQKHKTRRPLDVELKRLIENSSPKATATILILPETLQTLDSERGNGKNFKSRSDAAEYYLRKGFEAEGLT